MCITTTLLFLPCSHTYLSRSTRCQASQLTHGKFCEGLGCAAVKVEQLCPQCSLPEAPVSPLSPVHPTSSASASSASSSSPSSDNSNAQEALPQSENEKRNEVEKEAREKKMTEKLEKAEEERKRKAPGGFLEDIPEFQVLDERKRRWGAWGLGREVGMVGVKVERGKRKVRGPRRKGGKRAKGEGEEVVSAEQVEKEVATLEKGGVQGQLGEAGKGVLYDVAVVGKLGGVCA